TKNPQLAGVVLRWRESSPGNPITLKRAFDRFVGENEEFQLPESENEWRLLLARQGNNAILNDAELLYTPDAVRARRASDLRMIGIHTVDPSDDVSHLVIVSDSPRSTVDNLDRKILDIVDADSRQ